MLRLGSIRWRGKCSRHPTYDPYLDGRVAIRGGCERCALLAEIHERHSELLSLMKKFNPPREPARGKNGDRDRQANLFGESQ